MAIESGQSTSDTGDGRETICASVMNYEKINKPMLNCRTSPSLLDYSESRFPTINDDK